MSKEYGLCHPWKIRFNIIHLIIIIIIIIIHRFYMALFSVPKDALQKHKTKKDTNEQYSTYMHTYKYSKTTIQRKIGQ